MKVADVAAEVPRALVVENKTRHYEFRRPTALACRLVLRGRVSIPFMNCSTAAVHLRRPSSKRRRRVSGEEGFRTEAVCILVSIQRSLLHSLVDQGEYDNRKIGDESEDDDVAVY